MKFELESVDADIRDGLLKEAQSHKDAIPSLMDANLENMIPEGLPTQMQLTRNLNRLNENLISIWCGDGKPK